MKKGKKMPGQYGHERTHHPQHSRGASVDEDNNLLLIHGGVPGPNGGYVIVRETNKVE